MKDQVDMRGLYALYNSGVMDLLGGKSMLPDDVQDRVYQLGCENLDSIKKFVAHMTVIVETQRYDHLPLECDGMVRVLSKVLTDAGLQHTVWQGMVVNGDETLIPLHFWIEYDGLVLDYRLRMRLSNSFPHSLFNPERHGDKFQYVKTAQVDMAANDMLFAILTNGMGSDDNQH